MSLPPCPLCHSGDIRILRSLSARSLIQLWAALGFHFPVETLGCVGEAGSADLLECANCGFHFFDPEAVGDSRFYEALFAQKPAAYYASARPEFDYALAIASRENCRRVLDIGCGNGLFLQQARSAGLEGQGIELSSTAAGAAREKGFHVLERSVDKCTAADFGGLFDLVCLFQVLEHVKDPLGAISDAGRLLRPGGSVIVSVPSEDGVLSLFPLDPHQWPPHHVTRWRKKDFRTLARQTAMNLKEMTGSHLSAGDISYFWTEQIRLQKILDPTARTTPLLWVKTVVFCFWALGLRFLCLPFGHSIHAHLKKPH